MTEFWENKTTGEKVMRIDPEEYKYFRSVDGGVPLAEVFPKGLYVSFRGDEVIEIAPDPTEKMRELGLTKN
jgi:hypothetical protein